MFIKQEQFKTGRKESLPGGIMPPWRLHRGIFWKPHFITFSRRKDFRKGYEEEKIPSKNKMADLTVGSSFGSSVLF